jgi:FMN hydrolase / 5-amino-6-(5-phospho-D-ribitylamino)uracil phosphatase
MHFMKEELRTTKYSSAFLPEQTSHTGRSKASMNRVICMSQNGVDGSVANDEEADILAWKRLERVLTEKAKAEARAKAEAKAKGTAKKPPRPILVWDVMSTICYDPFYNDVPAFFGISLDELYKVKDKSSWDAFETGKISEDEMLDRFFLDRRSFDHRGLVDAVTSKYAFLPGMERLLDTLTGMGYPMHAMSNYPLWWRTVEERLRLSRFLRWTFVSCEAGVRKPDPAAYRAVLERLKAPADRCARSARPVHAAREGTRQQGASR